MRNLLKGMTYQVKVFVGSECIAHETASPLNVYNGRERALPTDPMYCRNAYSNATYVRVDRVDVGPLTWGDVPIEVREVPVPKGDAANRTFNDLPENELLCLAACVSWNNFRQEWVAEEVWVV